MRISDWSSDVCSSDLATWVQRATYRADDGAALGPTQENDGVAAVRTNRIQRSSASLTGDLSRGGERRTQGAPRNGSSQPSPSSSSGDDCCAALACLLPRAKPLVITSGILNRSEEHTSKLQSLM